MHLGRLQATRSRDKAEDRAQLYIPWPPPTTDQRRAAFGTPVDSPHRAWTWQPVQIAPKGQSTWLR